jgi:hypothetical protein
LTFYRNQAILSPRMSTKEQKERIELLQGTLDLLILRTLLLGPMHGHAIAKAIEFRSDEVLQVEQGIALSRAAPAHQAAMDFGRRGNVGKQSPGQILQANGQGPTPTGG